MTKTPTNLRADHQLAQLSKPGPEPAGGEILIWRWMSLVEAGVLSRANQAIESGWVGETAAESTDELSLYVWGEEHGAKSSCLEWGSLMMELDVLTWDEGKRACEVMLRHARALNAELSRG